MKSRRACGLVKTLTADPKGMSCRRADIPEALDVEDQDAEEGEAAEDVDAGDAVAEGDGLQGCGAGELFLGWKSGQEVSAGCDGILQGAGVKERTRAELLLFQVCAGRGLPVPW